MIDRLIPMLGSAEKEQLSSQDLSNEPPTIIFKQAPSVLVSIDGEPKLKEINNSKLKQVVNSSFFILFDDSIPRYYLYASKDGWYVTTNLKEPWNFNTSAPEYIAKLAPTEDMIDAPVDSDEIEGLSAPSNIEAASREA